MSKTSTYFAIRTVAFYFAVHPDSTIKQASRTTGICWETVKDSKNLLEEIGFFEWVRIKSLFSKIINEVKT